jgi:mannose-6-phosphate isomerase-like protein (cupin superfamily)
MTYSTTTIADLGDGYFRKVRQALGVTAFGVNAVVVPVGGEGVRHYHSTQDELYFVHRGRALFEVDGERFELDEGGFCHVPSTNHRWFANAGDTELQIVVVGGKDGYVGRDGHLVDEADLAKRQALSSNPPPKD